MKKFKSHKVVEAAKITAVEKDRDGLRVALEGGEIVDLYNAPAAIFGRVTEEDLGYFVRYPDGYVSWSPTKAFEDGYTEEGEHAGLPVAGYKPQNDDKVNTVNKNKILEERALRRIDALKHENTVARSAGAPEPYDGRMLALAFTGIQDAFMWLNRAVFQPDRVALPEDDEPSE